MKRCFKWLMQKDQVNNPMPTEKLVGPPNEKRFPSKNYNRRKNGREMEKRKTGLLLDWMMKANYMDVRTCQEGREQRRSAQTSWFLAWSSGISLLWCLLFKSGLKPFVWTTLFCNDEFLLVSHQWRCLKDNYHHYCLCYCFITISLRFITFLLTCNFFIGEIILILFIFCYLMLLLQFWLIHDRRIIRQLDGKHISVPVKLMVKHVLQWLPVLFCKEIFAGTKKYLPVLTLGKFRKWPSF